MNSPISGSDDASAWGRCLAACLGTLMLGGLLLFALLMAVDPYDSGRFGWLGIEGVRDRNPRLANASRAHDPQYDSAVIGDSTAMLLGPAELSRLTGARFVKLTGYGLAPLEQLATLEFFIKQHQQVGALVVVTDVPWCTRDRLPTTQQSFPFWLYGDSPFDYVTHLFSWPSLEHLAQRGMIGLGWLKRDNPDGYEDYEEIWPPGQFRETAPPADMLPTRPGKESDPFPVVLRLERLLRQLPTSTPVILVMPPTFHTLVPRPGSVPFAENLACAEALKRVISNRPRSNLIDFRVDNALTRDPANFADLIHYRAKIARRMEAAIAASIQFGADAKIDF